LQIASVEQEIEQVKTQRADMWREITRLKEMNEAKTLEQTSQSDQISALNSDLSKVSGRIEET
jgi:predicted  nucleic acid-binding Zn-ribbon protein